MAKWKARQPAPTVVIENRLFWDRWALPLAVLLVLIAILRVVAADRALSITTDEPNHFACGLDYLAKHTFTREPKHPPLARAAAALLPYLDGAHPLGFPMMADEGVAVLDSTGDPLGTLEHARWGILPFFVLACTVVFVWTRRIAGSAAAVAATGLFTLLPNVLCDAGFVTTDMAVAGCLSAAFLALLWWAERPTWRRSAILGLASAMAAVSKMTALAFFPAAAAFALLGWLVVSRPRLAELSALPRKYAAGAGIAAAVGALVIWAVYFFHVGKVAAWGVTLPAPEFFQGILDAQQHNDTGQLAFLLGKTSQTGWWYYFPVAIAVKTPIGFLALLAVGAALCWKHYDRGAWLPAAYSLGIIAVTMVGHVDIGIRHILPAYVGFAVLAGIGFVELAKRPAGQVAAAALAAWMAVSVAIVHPDYLTYFNAFAGSHPEDVLEDSNIDWGQDLQFLSKWLDEHHVDQIGVYGVELAPLHAAFQKWYGLPPMHQVDSATLTPGWYAVGQTVEHVKPSAAGFRRMTPVAKFGGVFLYQVK